ncbi:hypothetical protein N39L_45790 [Limnospira platensis NIES-39]|nr:hypothetical protein N39L_45790 [Arthrospira platensis NIES-39]
MPFTLSSALFARPQQDREMLVVVESPHSPLHVSSLILSMMPWILFSRLRPNRIDYCYK